MICRWTGEPGRLVYIKDSHLERLVFNISSEAYTSFYKDNLQALVRQKDGDELLRVILVWCETKFNATESSQRLHIHKNTLSYRINRIQKISGLDLKNFKEATALYIAVTLYYLKPRGYMALPEP